tara:strand:+ start:1028 stop:1654 length:627 start_codon:yes stop_codon:yes gene_type:complete
MIFIFKGYKYIYKIDNNDNTIETDQFKYSLFNHNETNNLNKLLLDEIRVPTEINNNQTLIRLKIHNFKENMNEGLDKMVNSIKNIYKKNNMETIKTNKTKYSKVNNNQEFDNIELISHNINNQTQNYNYNNYSNPNRYNNYSEEFNNSNNTPYLEEDLNSTINTVDLNSTINTVDLNISVNNSENNIHQTDKINNKSENVIFHSVMSR